MREMNFPRHLELVAISNTKRCRCPFPNAIHRQNSRTFKRRRVKRACCMALMMFGEQKLPVPIKFGGDLL